MAYNYIPKYIRQSENKSPKSVVTAPRWNELFNLLIQQGDHTAEELGKILDYLSTGLEDLTNEKLDKTGGVISGDLGVTGKLNIGTTVAITETNNNLLQLAGDYGAPVTISNVDTPVADNDAATKKYVDEHMLPEQTEAMLNIDAVIDFKDITKRLHNDLKRFSPFGPCNPKPIFCTVGVYDYGTSKVVGRGQEHIKLELVDNKSNTVMNGIAFGQSSQARLIKTKQAFDIVYSIEENTHKRGDVQLQIEDIRPSS